ncbi:hypothetical protein ACTXT7_016760 [Hymenolepis weldensis]
MKKHHLLPALISPISFTKITPPPPEAKKSPHVKYFNTHPPEHLHASYQPPRHQLKILSHMPTATTSKKQSTPP